MSTGTTIDPTPVDRLLFGEHQGRFHEHYGRAMGSRLHIVVLGDPDLIDMAVGRVEQIEARWSRFRPNSEVSRCNSTRGIPVDVSADTRTLVRHAIHGWRETNGAYDPTVLDALIAGGYDRSYDHIVAEGATTTPGIEAAPAPGCEGIEINDELGTVTLPLGTGFDPGGIGKGLAADMLAEELISAGARGALVNLGGDLRIAGEAPGSNAQTGCSDRNGWAVEINEPTVQDTPIGLAVMIDGGLATSTTRRRVWTVDRRPYHHVIDPRFGSPIDSRAQLATVISGRAWWSEVLATQLLLAPADQWADVTGDAASLVIDTDGTVHIFGSMEDHLR